MNAHPRISTNNLLDLLQVPQEGRVLAFGPETALFGLEIAVARPDTLTVVCDAEYQKTTEVADRATADRLDNLIIGDTPAGPLVDRSLCIDGLSVMEARNLVTIRTAMLPGGYAIFIESKAPEAAPLLDKLLTAGYQVTDELPGALDGSTVIRAR